MELKKKFKFIWLLQPILIALFPIIQMFSQNPVEINYTQFILATTIISFATTFLFICCYCIYKNSFQGAILANSLVLLFYLSTPLVNVLLIPLSKNFFTFTLFGIRVLRIRYILPIIIIISIYFVHTYLVKKIKIDFFLKMFLFPLLAIVAMSFTKGAVARQKHSKIKEQYQLLNQKTRNNLLKKFLPNYNLSNKPDIYFIILDSYSSKDYLKQVCNFNNEKFLNELKNLGFYVANKSFSNYWQTLQSLPATLNLNYLTHNKKSIPYFFMWRNNNVAFLLKKLGYKYIDLSKEYFPTYFKKSQKQKSAFGNILYELKCLLTHGDSMGGIYIESWTPLYAFLYKYYFKSLRTKIIHKLNLLEEITKTYSPKFVYAHILPPHEPHVLDNSGNLLITDESKSDLEKNIHGYTESIRYLNKRILKIIDNILQKSKNPPVIILQGDHGLDHTSSHIPNRFKILNAYYLPSKGNKKLYQTLSPVNNFRIIFNNYFGTNFPMLKDESFCGPMADGRFEKLERRKSSEK